MVFNISRDNLYVRITGQCRLYRNLILDGYGKGRRLKHRLPVAINSVANRLNRQLNLLNILRMNEAIVLISIAVRFKNIRQLRVWRDALPGYDIILQQLRILRVNKGAVIGDDHEPDIARAIMIHAFAAHGEITTAGQVSAGVILNVQSVLIRRWVDGREAQGGFLAGTDLLHTQHDLRIALGQNKTVVFVSVLILLEDVLKFGVGFQALGGYNVLLSSSSVSISMYAPSGVTSTSSI